MVDMDKIIAKLQERIESGVAFMLGAYGNQYVSERLARKYMGDWAEMAVGVGSALALDIIGISRRMGGYDKYIDKVSDALSDYGFYQTVLEYKLKKAPIAYFKDGNTLVIKNMDADTIDPAYVKVYVDDVAYKVDKTEGEIGSFTAYLASTVDSGWHKLVVVVGNQKKDTVRRKVYVP